MDLLLTQLGFKRWHFKSTHTRYVQITSRQCSDPVLEFLFPDGYRYRNFPLAEGLFGMATANHGTLSDFWYLSIHTDVPVEL